MATVKVNVGKDTLELSVDDSLSDAEIDTVVKEAVADYTQQNLSPVEETSKIKQAYNFLDKPRQLSKQGLGEIASLLPETGRTQSTALNVAIGAPRVAVETLQQVAPEFIDPVSIISAGAVKGAQLGGELVSPLVKGAGKLAAQGVEKVLGISAESVTKVFQKPLSLITAPTKKAVKAAYDASEVKAFNETLEGVVTAGTSNYARQVRVAGKAILEGEKDAQKILRGRRALDKQVAAIDSQLATSSSGSNAALIDAKNAKLALRAEFNKVLDTIAPKLRKADKAASAQLAVDPFRRLTLPGDINFTSPAGIARGVPFLPTLAGGTIAGAGAITKGLGALGGAVTPGSAVTSSVLLQLLAELQNKQNQ